MAYAFDIDASEIFGGPKWMDSDGFDINAKIPEEFAHGGAQDKTAQMIQNLLARRFQMAIHREQRQISGYLLVVAKKGPKIALAKADEKDTGMHTKNWHLVATNVTMEALAKYLTHYADKPVVDKSELSGGFNFELVWMPEKLDTKPEASADPRPSIFTAVQEQLGLRLESAQVPIQAIVIDRAEKPDPN